MQFSLYLGWWAAWSSSTRIELNLCEVKIFLLQSLSNAITCIDQRFADKDSGISCLALIFNLSNPNRTMLHAKNQFKVVIPCESYTVFFTKTIWTHGLVVKANWCESDDMGSIPAEYRNSLLPLGHFVLHWAPQCTDTSAFILLHSLYFFFLSWISSLAIFRWHGFNS